MRTNEQRLANIHLEFDHPATQCGLGDVQGLGGSFDASECADLHEIAELQAVQRHINAMHPILAIALAALPTFLSGLEQSVMSTSAVSIAGQLGNEAALAWILAAFFIAASVATPVYGRLSDHFGPIQVLIVAILIFALGGLIAAQAGNFQMLVGARFIQGIGGGGLISLPQAFLSQTIAPCQRAAYQGYLVAIAFIANTFGPPLGGFLIDGLRWQAIFWLQVPLAVTAACLLATAPKARPHGSGGSRLRFDWLGALFLMVAVASLIMLTQALSRSSSAGLPAVWAAIFLAASTGLVFVERSAADPLLPLSLLRGAIVWKCGMIVFLYGFLFTGLSSYVPVLFRKYYALSSQEIGLLMMPLLGAIGVGLIITGQLVRRSGRTMIFPTCGLLIVGSILLAFIVAMQKLSPLEAAFWMGVNGLFMGSTLGVVQVALQIGSPSQMIGRATAFLQLSRTIGASFGAGLGGLIYQRTDRWISNGVAAETRLPESLHAHIQTGAPALPFCILFAFFALISIMAALTAKSCKVPTMD